MTVIVKLKLLICNQNLFLTFYMHFQGFCQKVTNTLLVQVYCSDSTWNSGKSWKTQWMLFWSQKKKQKKNNNNKKTQKYLRGFKRHLAKLRDFCILSWKAEFQVITFFSLISSFFMQSLSCWKALFRLALNLYAFTSQSWSQKAFF